MTQTNIDYLFQVTGPHADRGLGASPRRAEQPPFFSDHLSQASAPTGNEQGKAALLDAADDDPRPESRNRTDDSSRNDGPDRSADSSPIASANDDDRGTAAPDDATSADAEAAADNSHSDEAKDPADDETRDEATAPETAVAQIAAPNAGAALVADTGSSEVAKPPADAVAATSVQRIPSDQTDAKLPNGESLSLSRTLELVASDGLEQNAAAIAQANENAASGPAIAPTHADELAGSESTSSAATGNRRGKRNAQAGQPRAAIAGNGEAAAEAGEGVEAQGELKEELSASRAADEKVPSSDDRRRTSNSRMQSRSVARLDAIENATNVAVAAVANAAAAPTGDATANSDAADEGTQQTARAAAAKGEGLVASLARSPRGNPAAHRNGQATKDDDAPRIDAARFVGRVAKAFQTAHDRGGTLQLRLSPPELGSLRLELTVKDGVLTAALETETASARRVLLDHLPALRDRLAEQNIRVERFDVDVRREGGGGQADDGAMQQQQQQPSDQPPSRRQPAPQARVGPTARPDAPVIPSRTKNTGINLVA